MTYTNMVYWLQIIGGVWLLSAGLLLVWNYGAHRNDDPDDDWFR